MYKQLKACFFACRPFWAGLWTCCLLWAGTARGQLILQVVSQKMSTSFAYQPGQVLHIDTERADIHLQGWDKEEVQLELQLIAKHRDRSKAEAALKQFHYQAERIGQHVYVKNTLPEAPTNAYLKAVFVLHAPRNSDIQLTNKLGKVFISDMQGATEAEGYLCMFELNKLGGRLQLRSNLGNVRATQLAAESDISVQRAGLEIEGMTGDLSITGIYASVVLSALPHSSPLHIDVETDKSDILLRNFPSQGHEYHLQLRHGSLQLPAWPGWQQSEDGQRARFTPGQAAGRIHISTTYGHIRFE
ncbi:MAG: hypothetical protein D6730_06560 [Bacteroidetes bacterium]|nr:MAG: hypothetical protein D6730_06560 [Bacteroidota bacterium]